MTHKQIADWVRDARQRTCDLVADLTDEQLRVPRLAMVNPPLWEIGHVAWFQEKWVLRRAAGSGPLRANFDALYDSAAVPHDTRWDLPLPGRDQTLRYLAHVRDQVLDTLSGPGPSREDVYFLLLSVFHEDMHAEAFSYTRQTLGYPAPGPGGGGTAAGPMPGDAEVPGGTFRLGADPAEPFVFDNEKWAHAVELAPFAVARAPVTQAEFAAFVEDGGYRRRDCWGESGWRWREQAEAAHPVYWRREAPGRWLRRDFDRWVPLEPDRPVLHVNWYEADAYCRWAGRRLPTEAEWEAAAAGGPGGPKRHFPWGDGAPGPARANLDGRAMGCVDVGALPGGDAPSGCRQMIGNVWEWTADDFLPYPGFAADPYKEYSAPWFGTHKVLRGGCWASRSRLLRNTWRNFFRPERRDIFAGFRTCAAPP
jgi:iron(II)-dependent oxidoreductase